MIRYGDVLSNSGLLFSYKPNHFTTMCSLTLKEVVNYYRKRHSHIYAVSIDAPKALDSVKNYRLFSILIKYFNPSNNCEEYYGYVGKSRKPHDMEWYIWRLFYV